MRMHRFMAMLNIVLFCYLVQLATSEISITLLHPASDFVLAAGQPLIVKATSSGLSSSSSVFLRVAYGIDVHEIALNPEAAGLWSGDSSHLVTSCTPPGFPLTIRVVASPHSCSLGGGSHPTTSGSCRASDETVAAFISSATDVHVLCVSSSHTCNLNRSCVSQQVSDDQSCGSFISGITDTAAPYMSVVLSGRNDEAMGDFSGRVQAFIDHFSIAAWAINMSAEIIVVEWNPPASRPALASVLKSGAPHNRLPVFVATVGVEMHARLSKASSTEFFEYAAKNVGIRLARGSWILVANPDSLFTLPMLRFLSLQRLTPGYFYRAHRDNIGRGQWPSIGAKPWLLQPYGRLAQLEARAKLSLHWSSMEGGRQLVSDSSSGTCLFGNVPSSRQLLHAAQSTDQPYAVAPGDFLIASSVTWNALGAYPDIINTAFLDYLQPCRMVGTGLKEVSNLLLSITVPHKYLQRSLKARTCSNPSPPSDVLFDRSSSSRRACCNTPRTLRRG